MNTESESAKIDIRAENEEAAANESGIEIVEQDEMLEGTTMIDRRAETTEIYLMTDVVEAAEGEGIEVIEVIAVTEGSQLNEAPTERRAPVLHQRRRNLHQT